MGRSGEARLRFYMGMSGFRLGNDGRKAVYKGHKERRNELIDTSRS